MEREGNELLPLERTDYGLTAGGKEDEVNGEGVSSFYLPEMTVLFIGT